MVPFTFFVEAPRAQVIVYLGAARDEIFLLEALYPFFIMIVSRGFEYWKPDTSMMMFPFFAETTAIAAEEPPASVAIETVNAVAASAGFVSPHRRAASLNGMTAL